VIGNMSRRGFLGYSVPGCSMLACSGARSLLAAKTHITKARISAITDEIGRTQSDAIAFAKQNGLEWVELRSVPESGKEFASLPEPELKQYASELAAAGLKVSLLKTSLLKFPWPELSPGPGSEANTARWNRRKDDLARSITAARILGTDKIRIFTGARAVSPEAASPAIARVMEEFVPAAEAARVRLLIENEPTQNVGTCVELKAILDLVPSKSLGFNWDPQNTLALHETAWPEGYALLPKARMWNMQIKAEGLADGPRQINWRKLLNAVQKDGYGGEISLATEIFNGTFEKASDGVREIQHIVGELD
jgi:sugar phosphate isomerase/epimerase